MNGEEYTYNSRLVIFSVIFYCQIFTRTGYQGRICRGFARVGGHETDARSDLVTQKKRKK